LARFFLRPAHHQVRAAGMEPVCRRGAGWMESAWRTVPGPIHPASGVPWRANLPAGMASQAARAETPGPAASVRARSLGLPERLGRRADAARRAQRHRRLTAGSGGSIWFTDFGTGQIGELPPGGSLRLFPVPPTPGSAASPAAQTMPCGTPSRQVSSARSPPAVLHARVKASGCSS